MIYNISHRTIYEYTAPVTVSHHAARVEPRGLPQQETERFSLHIEPTPPCKKRGRIILATVCAGLRSKKYTTGWRSRQRVA